MAISKEILVQYADLQQECAETRDKITRLKEQIEKLEIRIKEIEDGETVKDKVKGGLGGIQNFNIEGIPIAEYERARTNLLSKKLMLNNRKSALEIQEFDLLQMTNEVEEFIRSLEDSRMRRIINLRFIEGLSWYKVSEKIDKNSTEDGVRMEFSRFMKNI